MDPTKTPAHTKDPPEALLVLAPELGAVLEPPASPLARLDLPACAPPLVQEGQPWVCPDTGMEFLWVPPGEFWMGSCPDKPSENARPNLARRYDEDASRDEYPGGLVAIARGYWIAKHPVTHGGYARFLAERGSVWPKAKPSGWDDPKAQRAADVPVVNVDWFDALLFCCWLTRKLAAQLPPDHRILLPTEAQWERAARGTDARKYPWGDDAPTPAHAVFGDAPLAAVEGRPAGASPVGCHDMAGNVWEWCLTAYTADLQGLQQDPGAAPSGVSEREWGLVTNETLLSNKPSSSVEPACAVARVLRGGSWIYVPRFLRCAFRDGDQPSGQDLLVGFRVCCA